MPRPSFRHCWSRWNAGRKSSFLAVISPLPDSCRSTKAMLYWQGVPTANTVILSTECWQLQAMIESLMLITNDPHPTDLPGVATLW